MATAASPILHSEDLDVLPLDPRYTHPVKAATLPADGPVLERIYADHEDIDWIGRWDASKTARWAGSSLRFRFNGPLLFLIPGDKTIATDSPMIGWQIDGGGKTYTSHARKGRSIRLWPPEGVAHPALPITPGLDDANDDDNLKSTQGTRNGHGGNAQQTASTKSTSTSTSTTSTPARPTLTGSRQSTSTNLNLSLSTGLHVNDDHQEVGPDEPTPRASTFAESQLQHPASASASASASSLTSSSSSSSNSHLIEITLIDWGSIFQVNHFEMLAGSKISPAYQIGKSNLPTLLFIGDSTTCGYLPNEPISHSRPQFRRNSRRRHEEGAYKQDDDASQDEYSGFLDAFPSHLKLYLAPGIRIYSIAFPGISLVDDSNLSTGGSSSSSGAEENGMESKFFKIGPLEPDGIEEEDNEWTFEDREDGNAPTHIFVNLGANDVIDTEKDVEKFLETLENFLGLLKETYGRRTGDILVMSPFGEYQDEIQESIARPGASGKLSNAAIIPSNHQASQSTTKEGGSSSSSSSSLYTRPLTAHIKNEIEELSEKWRLESEDPLASGQFPDTPILEYTKSQLDQEIPLSPRSPSSSSFVATSVGSRPNSASFTSGALQMQQQQDIPSSVPASPSNPSINMIKSTSMTSIASSTTTTTFTMTTPAATRPALIVRPSSIAAAVAPTEEKGTTTKLHFIDTSGWLDAKEDTFEDGLHPTSKGARKIAKKLKKWLGENGFLTTTQSPS